jgi:hypothetical protein
MYDLVGREGDGMTYSREWFRFERMIIAGRLVKRGPSALA